MRQKVVDFFAYARERHSVYLRRRAGLQPPSVWTQDPILQEFRFTNVFRELDRTTEHFRRTVRDPLRSSGAVLLATVLWRWFNRTETGDAMFVHPYDAGSSLGNMTAWELYLEDSNTEWLRRAIHKHVGPRGPFVTGAYIIRSPGGMDKLTGVLDSVRRFRANTIGGVDQRPAADWVEFSTDAIWRNTSSDNLPPLRLEQVWEWLGKFDLIGDFMAYEVVSDLRWTDLLSRAPDVMTWANPGPGAARGLGRVFHDNRDKFDQHNHKDQLIRLMRELLEMSRDPQLWPQRLPHQDHDDFYMSNCDFASEFQGDGDWPVWEMREVEHTLCEFDKYERTRTGEGRPRGTFRKSP